MNQLFKEYPCVYTWHKLTGSFNHYIEDMCRKAKIENAPRNSLYVDHETKLWVTLDDLSPNHDMRPALEKALKESEK